MSMGLAIVERDRVADVASILLHPAVAFVIAIVLAMICEGC